MGGMLMVRDVEEDIVGEEVVGGILENMFRDQGEVSLVGVQVVYRRKQWKISLERGGGLGCRGFECQDGEGFVELLKDVMQS